jgi:ABC-2 type transport system permease protein
MSAGTAPGGSAATGGAGLRSRTLRNIRAVARREFMSRGRTRVFRFSTIFLVIGGIALALAPIAIRWFEGAATSDRIEVVGAGASQSVDVVAALGAILNSPEVSGSTGGSDGGEASVPAFVVSAAADLEAARAHVLDGSTLAVLALDRASTGELGFELYSRDGPLSRKLQVIRQASISIAVQDRLTRAGIPPLDQAKLFAPPDFEFRNADPTGAPGPANPEEAVSEFAISFVLSIALFMAIILYGQWIAYSVAEEKNSRVMEVVLAAATPFQLLAGKLVGVGGLALLQYVVVMVPTAIAVLLQGQVAALVFGSSGGSVSLPPGISIEMLLVFGVMFVLGFALYATLYAGAASLVSRQEDINMVVAPLTFISVGGYLVATYAGTGLIPIDSPLVVILSFIPFFSPFLMLTRMGAGTVAPLEILLAVALLAVAIPAAIWVAARLYRSGVLMYGQRPTPRTLLRALRAG